MEEKEALTSAVLSPERARGLVIAIERRGLDSGRIHIDAPSPVTATRTGRADGRSVRRPGFRAGVGLVGGAGLGLLLGLIITTLTDAPTGGTLIAMAIAAALIGALAALYVRLPMSTEISDVDSGASSVVHVDVAGLDRATVADVTQIMAEATGPSER